MLDLIDYKWALAGIAALISICNLIYYISTVVKGKTKPHMYTWLIWGIITIIAATGQITDHGGVGSYFTLIVAFNCFIIATLAFFKGEKNIAPTDKWCLGFCFLALLLWPITKIPLLSIVIVTLIDLTGFIPTIRKSYNKPHEENLISFSVYIITFSIGILALENYSFLTLLYPATITIATFCVVIMLTIRRKQLGYKIFA